MSPSAVLDHLTVPIVQAPMAGGPSTPRLAGAVSAAGGLGFLAAGYLGVDRLEADVAELRDLGATTFGVNVFVGGGGPAGPGPVERYAARLAPRAERAGVELGTPRFDDDSFAAKVGFLAGAGVEVVSFTFGLPPAGAVDDLRAAGSEVWVTVTSPSEAVAAAGAGATALVVQGVEAGGHRGVFADDDTQSDLTLLAALQLVGAEVDLPLVGSGSIMTGAALAAVLAGGASAAQLGSAYLRCPEAGTPAAQRAVTASGRRTVVTRAFSGRTARAIENRWQRELGDAAPAAYPEVHHLTSPLRAHGRWTGDADLFNLWAGQAHALGTDEPAEQLTRRLGDEARAALAAAGDRWR